MTDRKLEYWVIPPEADAEFVAGMEEVLDTYAASYDSKYPVLCMDEQPLQLLKENIGRLQSPSLVLSRRRAIRRLLLCSFRATVGFTRNPSWFRG